MLRLRKRLLGRDRWVTGVLLLMFTHTSVDANQDYLNAYKAHQAKMEVIDRVVDATGLPAAYVKDPEGWRVERAKRTEALLEIRERAGLARAVQAAELLNWGNAPEHEKRKARVLDRYRAWLMDSTQAELQRIGAPDTASLAASNPTRSRVLRLRRDKSTAQRALFAYDAAMLGYEQRAERLDAWRQGELAQASRKRAKRLRGHLGDTMAGLREAVETSGVEGLSQLEATRPLIGESLDAWREARAPVGLVERDYGRQPTLKAPQPKTPLQVVELKDIDRETGELLNPGGGGLMIAPAGGAGSWLSSLLLSVLPEKPGSEVPEEVPASQEVIDLAAALNHDPLEIYNHLRTQFEFEPYWGLMRGPRGTLLEGGGSAHDLSSLLVALLRQSGINCEYVWGRVELSAEQLANVTGIDDLQTAGEYLATAGIPTTLVTDTDGVVQYALVQHVWVVAALDYSPSRGARYDENDYATTGAQAEADRWIPLDVAFKEMSWQDGIDLRSVSFDGLPYLREGHEVGGFILKERRGPDPADPDDTEEPLESPLEWFRTELWSEIDSTSLDCATLDAVTRRGRIAAHPFPHVPGSLMVKRLDWSEERRWTGGDDAVPSVLVHEIRFLMPGLDETLTMASVYGKHLTIEYEPVPGSPSSCDDIYTDFAGDCQVVPQLMLYENGILAGAGSPLATGDPVPTGDTQTLEVRWVVPGDEEDVLTHSIVAGSLGFVGIDYGGGPESLVQEAQDELMTALDPATGATDDEKDLTFLAAASRRYFRDFADDLEESFALKHVRVVRRAFGGFFQRRLQVGVGEVLLRGNQNVDLNRLIVGPFAIDGNHGWDAEAVRLAGYSSSFREHDVWESTAARRAVSTVKALDLADDDVEATGNSIVTLDGTNVSDRLDLDALLGTVPDGDKDAIWDFLSPDLADRSALVTYDQVCIFSTAFPGADCEFDTPAWKGAAYILEKPDGAASYIIAPTVSTGSLLPDDLPPIAGGDTYGEVIDKIEASLGAEDWQTGITGLMQALASLLGFGSLSDNPFGGPGEDPFGPGGPFPPDGHTKRKRGSNGVWGGDPVNMINGNFLLELTDLTVATGGLPVVFTRVYNSLDDSTGVRPIGSRWTHNYNVTLCADDLCSSTLPDGNALVGGEEMWLREPDGTRHRFERDAGNTIWISPKGKYLTLDWDVLGGVWTLETVGGFIESFEPVGPAGSETHARLSRQANQPLLYTESYLEILYDGSDRLQVVRDAKGRDVLTFGYDVGSDLIETIAISIDDDGDPLNDPIYRYGYTGTDLAEYRDPALWVEDPAKFWGYEYSGPGGRMSRTVRPDGKGMTNHYDARNRVHAQTDELDQTTWLAYDDDAEVAVEVGPGGSTHLVGFDVEGRFTESVDAAGSRRTLTWNDSNDKESATNARGQVVQWTHDSGGQVTLQESAADGANFEDDWTQSYESTYGRVASRTERAAGGAGLTLDNATTTSYVYTDGIRQTETTVDPADLGDPSPPVPHLESTTTAEATGQVGLMIGADKGDGDRQQTDYSYSATDGSLETVARATALDGMGDPTAWSTTTLTSDSQGRMETMSPPAGDPMTLGYDPSGRMEEMLGGSSGDMSITYNSLGWQTELESSRNGITSFLHDDLGRVTSQTSPSGTVETGYTRDGKVAWTKDARGSTTRTEYDEYGRVSKRINVDGTEYTFDYCSDFGCASCGSASACEVLGPDGQVVLSREHDDMGRVTKVTDAAGNWVEMEYDTAGRLWKRRWQQSLHLDPEQPIPTAGNAEQTLEIVYEYDHAGRLVKIIEPGIAGSSDPLEQPDARTTEYVYDVNGQRTQVIDAGHGDGASPARSTWDYEYDFLGQLVKETTPLVVRHWETGPPTAAIETEYAYDSNGNRTVVFHADGTGMRYVYEEADPGGAASECAYDLDSGYTAVDSGDGDARTLDVVYHFSGVADLAAAKALATEPPDGALVLESRHLYHDISGLPCREWNGEVTQDYSYTSKNQLASTTTTHANATAFPKILSFTYYSTGQRETMLRPDEDEDEPVRYFYDAMNRLSVLDDETNGGRFDFEYDAYGRRSKLSFPNGLTTYYEYTAAGARESILTVSASGVPLQSWVYAYDSAGNPISKTDIDGNVERYGYDSRGRLVRTDYPDGTTTDANGNETTYARFDGYRYDPVGNRLDEWREYGVMDGEVRHVSTLHDDANRLVSETSDPLDHDTSEWGSTHEWMAQGAMLKRTVSPAIGVAEVTSFTYDPADHLLGYTVGLDSQTAAYDARGRRVSVTQDPFVGEMTSRRVVFDGLQEVSEFDGVSGAESDPPTRTQTTTRRLDEVIGSSLPPEAAGDDRPWRTHHGDLVQSGTLTADRDGGVESRGRYRAYGETLEGGDPAWGFAGRPHEVGGMVPLRARTYGPGLGAFLSADPLDGYEGAPQTMPDYAYAANSPALWTDSTGREPVTLAIGGTIFLILLGAFVVAAGAFIAVQAHEMMGEVSFDRYPPSWDDGARCTFGLGLLGLAMILMMMGAMWIGLMLGFLTAALAAAAAGSALAGATLVGGMILAGFSMAMFLLDIDIVEFVLTLVGIPLPRDVLARATQCERVYWDFVAQPFV